MGGEGGGWKEEGGMYAYRTRPNESMCVCVCVYGCVYVCVRMCGDRRTKTRSESMCVVQRTELV